MQSSQTHLIGALIRVGANKVEGEDRDDQGEGSIQQHILQGGVSDTHCALQHLAQHSDCWQ